MKYSALLLSVALCLLPLRAQGRQDAAHPSAIHYSFDVAAADVIHVTMELPVRADGTEVLTLPSNWGGQTELFHAIRNLHVLGVGQTLRPTESPARWLLQSRTAGVARLGYDLVQDRSGPLRPPEEHRVILAPELWAFNGDNGLVLPAHRGDGAVHATFDFVGVNRMRDGRAAGGFATERALVTSFGESAHQEYRGTWAGVANALFAGGNLQLRRFAVDGEPVLLAATPAMDGAAAEIAPKLHDLLQAEQHFWREPAAAHAPRYTMLLAVYDGVHEGGGGSAFTDASALFLAPGQPVNEETLALVAHETMHQWLPQGMGFVTDTQEIGWFAEGFARFYENVMLVRAGLLSHAGYLARVNAVLRSYRASPEMAATNAELRRAAAGERFGFEAPYVRGAMVALWLDGRIDAASAGRSGLSDLLRALREERGTPLTAERIFQTASRFVDPASIAQMRGFVTDGREVPVVPGSLGNCVAFAKAPAWRFSLGFDAASLAPNGRVRGVEADSNAYAAGVRNGQLLGGWSVWPGDAQREVTLQVQDRDGSRSRVSFLPRGTMIEVEQAAQIEGCQEGPRIAK